ncbi:sulfotransferase [Candidatus Thorarchaeota archaeon]|nr:MAG: sulfotransferase [Candidatus Thorarchaeota archaeon]
MKIKRTSRSSKFDFPASMFFLAKLVHDTPYAASTLHRLESSWMKSKIQSISITAPIYITGLARSGTTVVLEMLSQHKDIASHRYLHMVVPYAPNWFQKLANRVPIMTTPSERLHKDGLFVNRDSPEAVEEIFWQGYFENALDESLSNILDSRTNHPKFDVFYQENIKKLLLNRNASRYLAKNNYNVSRMEYLLKLFPDARFVLMIRNPFDHIASLAKQDAIFKEMEANDPRLLEWTKLIGHREFGTAKICINLDDFDRIKKIRDLWENKETYVQGWAVYWASVYEYVHKKLQEDQRLAQAVIVIRYEDLCDRPDEVIDQIMNHIAVDKESFQKVKQHYCRTLKRPSYYRTSYTEQEQEQILTATGIISSKFGYDL